MKKQTRTKPRSNAQRNREQQAFAAATLRSESNLRVLSTLHMQEMIMLNSFDAPETYPLVVAEATRRGLIRRG